MEGVHMLLFEAAMLALGAIMCYFRWLGCPYRQLSAAYYLYPRAAFYAAASAAVSAGMCREVEGEATSPVTITDCWAMVQIPGSLHFGIGSVRDSLGSWCKFHVKESVIGGQTGVPSLLPWVGEREFPFEIK